MIDHEVLKAKLAEELKKLGYTPEQLDWVVKELNYLSYLLIDIYDQEKNHAKQQPNQ